MKPRILDALWWTGMAILVAIIIAELIHVYHVGLW